MILRVIYCIYCGLILSPCIYIGVGDQFKYIFWNWNESCACVIALTKHENLLAPSILK